MFAENCVFEYPLPIFPTVIEVTFPNGFNNPLSLERYASNNSLDVKTVAF